jgi:N-acetyl-anhydromuramyl-L-alanine amidase AmpD
MIIYVTDIQHHSPRLGYKVDTIVLHATASSSAKGALSYFRNPYSKVSAHYIIDKDSTIYACVNEARAAWHAGKCYLPYANQRSIGIELVNKNDGVDPYPDTQILALRQLITEIKRRHPIRYLVSHAEIAKPKGRKTDPKGLDVESLREWAQLSYTIDAPAAKQIATGEDDEQPTLIALGDDTQQIDPPQATG